MSPGQHVDPQDLSSLQLELKGQQGGRSVAAIRQPCPPSRSYRAVPAAPSRDANCAPDQAGPGNNGAHANSASGGRLLANSAPRGWGKCWLLESNSTTACLPKSGARGCLHHKKMKFWGHLEASLDALAPSLHIISVRMLQQQQQGKKNTHYQKTYVPGYQTAVTKANAAFPQGNYRKTSSTDCVLQNSSFPHAPSFCSQPSSSHLSIPCPQRASVEGYFWLIRNNFMTPEKHSGITGPSTWAGSRRLMQVTGE